MSNTPEATPSPTVAVACDVRLGDMVRRSPDIDTIHMDPHAIQLALQQLDYREHLGDRTVVVIAAHDDTFFAARKSDSAITYSEEHDTIRVPFGGSPAAFLEKHSDDLRSYGSFSEIYRTLIHYATDRGYSPWEVMQNIKSHLDILSYLYPASRSDEALQRLTATGLCRYVGRVPVEGNLNYDQINSYALGRDLLTILGYPVSFISGYQISEAINTDSTANLVMGALFTFVWTRLDLRSRGSMPLHTDSERADAVANNPLIPQMVTVKSET